MIEKESELKFPKNENQLDDVVNKFAGEDNERVRMFENIHDDPAYEAMEKKVTARTNLDSQVQDASKSGQNYAAVWNKVNFREWLDGLDNFVWQYPEKTQAYAERWKAFIKEHPEVEKMNNAQWEDWNTKNKGGMHMNEYRAVARAVNYAENKWKIERLQPQVHETEAKITQVNAELGVNWLAKDTEIKTPFSRQKQELEDLQLGQIVSAVRTNIPIDIVSADKETLQEKQKELANLPYISGNDSRVILDYHGKDQGMMLADTEAIVGSVSPAFKNWSNEYQGRKGRVVEVAQELIKGTEESVDQIFNVSDPKYGVKLKKLSGPAGDLFFAADGTHRMAGAKLVQLPELPAQVEDMTGLSELSTDDPILKSEWEQRIKHGLIRGSVQEIPAASGQKSFNLKIEAQVLPWMSLPQRQLVKMTKVYCDLYPGSLDKIKSLTSGEKIPPEVLLDEVAMNYYLAGRWGEYDQKIGNKTKKV